jgi:signal transduction histidine kinase
MVNAARLAQVVVNLIQNALHALEGRRDPTLTIGVSKGAPGEALLTVADNGGGMSEETRARIFEPFFSAKPPEIGTGLGLSICHSLVSKLGGRIEVESKLGAGTTFRIYLPTKTEPREPPKVPVKTARRRRPRR